MIPHYSVTIVGAGPTGLMLANLLGIAGIRTLLVEQNAATVGEPRAVSIDDETLRVVQQIGLIEPVKSEIISGYGSEYLGPDRSMFFKVKPEAEPYGHPRRNAFRQPIFEAQLNAGLKRFASVDTMFECRCESFVEEESGILVNIRQPDGGTICIRSDYLIGCDGSWSPTREALGYTLMGSSLDERWLIIDLENSPTPSPETTVYCDPKRSGIMLPGPRDTRRYEFKLLPGETDEEVLAEDNIKQLLQSHDVVPGSRVIRKTVYHFHARIADHWGRERIWLAGDTAHLMPPFAGQGMNSGIRDAANLAWKLAAVVKGHIGPKLLESYERERRTHVEAMTRLALRMGTVFGPRSAFHGWIIRTAFRILKFWPKARTYFAEMKYKPAPRFDTGFLLDSQLSRRGIVGRLLPQPSLPDGSGLTKLDDLLGEGIALLGVDVDNATVCGLSLGKSWDKLISRRISLTSQDAPIFAPHSRRFLLVRPDRYVMARFALDEADKTASELEALLAGTWPVASARSKSRATADTILSVGRVGREPSR